MVRELSAASCTEPVLLEDVNQRRPRPGILNDVACLSLTLYLLDEPVFIPSSTAGHSGICSCCRYCIMMMMMDISVVWALAAEDMKVFIQSGGGQAPAPCTYVLFNKYLTKPVLRFLATRLCCISLFAIKIFTIFFFFKISHKICPISTNFWGFIYQSWLSLIPNRGDLLSKMRHNRVADMEYLAYVVIEGAGRKCACTWNKKVACAKCLKKILRNWRHFHHLGNCGLLQQ